MRLRSPISSKVVSVAVDLIVPILLVVVIPLLAAIYVSDHNAKERQYVQNIAACERGNLLRERINTKFAVYDRGFAGAALALSTSTTEVGGELYRVLKEAATTAPEALPLTDCLFAFDPPRWFWE